MPSWAQWRLLASLYSTQFLGLMFFIVAMASILREGGASLTQVGLVYTLGLVWPLKVLWAPWVDRYAISRWGHYRSWLLMAQAGMVLCLVIIGMLDVHHDFTVVYAWCLLMAVCSATQDIAVDGLACRLLNLAQRGIGNGLQIAGGLVGNLVGGGLMLILYPHIGWAGCCALLASLTAISWLQLLFYREPLWAAASGYGSYGRLLSFWRSPGRLRWLGLLLLYPASAAMAYSIVMPMLIDAGWSLARVGLVVNGVGSLVGLSAALAYGNMLRRLTRRQAMVSAAVMQCLGVAALALPALSLGTGGLAGVTVILYFLLYNPAATILATRMMDLSSRQSPATDYTLQYSVSQCGVMALTSVSAMLAESIGYGGVIAVAVALGLATVAASVSWVREAL